MNKVNVIEKFAQVDGYWNPAVVGALNGQEVKIVKFQGPFTWHHHDHEDELFYVIKGSFVMELRDKNIELNEGDFLVVPKGVEHRPNATEEVWVMLFEPASILNTGNVVNSFTKNTLKHL